MAENFERQIEKGKGEVIKLEVSEFKGKKLLNLRIWYTDEEGNLKPTKKGITISPEQYSKVKEAFLEAEQYMG